uniref:Uncharacterized protein n=1 Tax=Arundo donax TaxID=35708 RepID=A0A0A9AZC4_ARUDO
MSMAKLSFRQYQKLARLFFHTGKIKHFIQLLRRISRSASLQVC